MKRLRAWIAFRIAPWTYVPYREEREEAFRDLAEVAYGSRNAAWTSPGVLVRSALEHARLGRVVSRDQLAESFRDWLHTTPLSVCTVTADECPDWALAYELADRALTTTTAKRS